MSLTHKALHAFKWSVLGEVASRAIGPLVFLVMARLLVPADFGVVAAATVIISFSQVFSDAGLAKALIQRQDRTEESANVVFWLNLGIGLFVVAMLHFAAPQIASFFHDQRITPVVRVLSLQILLAAFSSVHTALLQKSLNFKQLFWVRLVTTGVPGLASIPLAMNGVGYWALVAGTLFGQVVQSIMLWNRSPWRPHWGMDLVLAGELIAFGKWAMLSGVLGWFYGWMDAIIVGHYLGSHDMGLYRTGNTFVTMIFGVIFSPLLPVLYSLFSRAQNDHEKLRAALVKVTHAIALIAIPIGFFLFVVSAQLADVLFGLGWRGVGPVIGFMALMHALSWIVGANGEIYRAIGKPHVETWANAALLAVYSAGYVIAVQYGLLIFLKTRLGLAILALLAHIVIARYIIHLPISNWLYWGVFGVSGAAAIAADLLGATANSPLAHLFLSGAIFALIISTGLLVFEKQFIEQLVRIAKNKRG